MFDTLQLATLNPGLDGAIFGLGISALLYGPLIAICLFLQSAAHSGSYLRFDGRTRKIYRPPAAYAACPVAFLAYIALLAVVFSDPDALTQIMLFGVHARASLVSALLCGLPLVALACWVGVLSQRRWYTLSLDLERRVCKSFSSGIIPKPWSGTWKDIVGVHVRQIVSNNKKPFCYYVELQWRGSSNVYATLGSFANQGQAEAYAEKTAQELHLPLVAHVADK